MAQIIINTADAVSHLNQLSRALGSVNRNASTFASNLQSKVIDPLNASASVLGKTANSIKTAVSGIRSVVDTTNRIFSDLNIGDKSGVATQLRGIVKQFNSIGKIDNDGSFSKLAKSFDSLGKGLQRLKSLQGSLGESNKIVSQLSGFVNQFKGLKGDGTQSQAADGFSQQSVRIFTQVAQGASNINKSFGNLKTAVQNLPSKTQVQSAVGKIKTVITEIGTFGAALRFPAQGDNKAATYFINNQFQGFRSVLSALGRLNGVMKNIQGHINDIQINFLIVKDALLSFMKEIGTFGAALRFPAQGDNKAAEYLLDNQFKGFLRIVESLKNFNKVITSLDKSSSKSDSIKVLTSNISLLVQSLGGLAAEPSFQPFLRLADAIQKVSRASHNLVTATNKAAKAVKNVGQSAKSATQPVSKLHSALRQFFTALVGYNVIYAVARSVQKATKQMVQLEYAMTRVNTITRVGSTTIRRWTRQVMQMSSTFGVAKQDVTKALYEINSATILGSQAMEVLNASVKAARAGYTDTTKVAELLSKVINAYGYSARDAAYLSDVLFKTVEVGINSMEQLSQYLGRVVTVAANAGVSFEEVSAAIATMTARGLQTNIAVTALNSAIMKLSQGNGKLNPVFRQMGYASSAAALATGGLSSAIQILHRATNGNTQALSKLGFNYRDIRAVTILASEAQSVFKQHLDDMKNSAGATDKALSQVADTLQYKWDQFKQTISNTVIEFQNFVNSSAILKGLLSVLSGVAQTFGQVAFALQQNLTLLQHFIKFIVVAYALNKAGKLIGKTLIHAFRKSSVQVKALTAEVRAFGFVFSSTGVRASFTLKKLIVSFKALRASMIAAKLSMVALKAVMSFGAALVQFALIQAALWAISKLTDDATDATKKYREEVSKMKKDLDNVLPGIYEAVGALQGAQLGSSNEKQLFQNAKDALSSLNQQIEQYESKKEQLRNKKGTNLAQYNQVKYTLRSLKGQRKALQEIIDAQAKVRHEYAKSNAQLRRTELNLKSIREGLQKSRSDRKDSIAKEFKDLVTKIQYKNLKQYFNQFGVDLDNARYNVSLFQTQVKDALKSLGNDKSGIDTFNKNLLKAGDLLFKIQKGLQKAADKLKPFKELQIIAKDPFGFGRQYLKLDQLIKQYQKFASKISKAQQVTITSNTSALTQAAQSPIDAAAVDKANLARAQLQVLMKKPISDFNTKFNLEMKKLQQEGTFAHTGDLANAKLTPERQFFKNLYDKALEDLSNSGLNIGERSELAFSNAQSQFKYYMKQNSYMSQDDLLKSLPQKLKNNQSLVNLIKQKDKYKVRDIPALLNSYREQVRKQEVSAQTQQKRNETLQSVRTLLRQGKITEAQGLHKQVFGTDLAYNKLITNQDTFDQWRKKLNAGQSVQDIFNQQMQALRQYTKAQGLSTQETQQLVKQLNDARKKFLEFNKNLDSINTKFMDIKGYGKQLTQAQLQKRISNRAQKTGGEIVANRTGFDWAHMFNQWSLQHPQDAPQSFSEYLTNTLKLSDNDKARVLSILFDQAALTQMTNKRNLGVQDNKRAFGNTLGGAYGSYEVGLRNNAYSSELHNLVQAQKQYDKQREQQARLLANEKRLTLQQHKAYSDARKTYIAAMDTFNRSIDDSYASMSFGRDFVHSQNYINARQAIDAQKAVYSGYLDDLAKVKQYQSLHPQDRLDDAARSVLGDKGAAKFLAANNTMRDNAAGIQAINNLVDDLKFGLGKPYSGAQGQYSNMRTSVKQQQQYLQRQRQKVLKLQKTHGQSWKQVYGLTNLAKLQQDVKNYKYNKERLDKYESALGGVPISTGVKAQTAMSMGSSEFVNMFLSQTTKTPQQKSLQSIDSTSKKILKSVNKSANINASLVII